MTAVGEVLEGIGVEREVLSSLRRTRQAVVRQCVLVLFLFWGLEDGFPRTRHIECV